MLLFLGGWVINFIVLMGIIIQKQLRTLMFVINFDFSQSFLPVKLLLVNVPVFLTEILTYPLQRLQTLLISKTQYITSSQLKQSQLILRQMVGIEGFPKLYHGLRYSLDFSMTQMTTKFVVFDFLMSVTTSSISQASKWLLGFNCILANTLSTVVSQSAFNYHIIASSLPINKTNRDENVRLKLLEYTRKNKVPLVGLRYTIPVSLLNTSIEIVILNKASSMFKESSYMLQSFLTILPIFLTTNFFTHFAIQRQVQLCGNRPRMSIPYLRGLLGTQIRQTMRGLTLFGFYLIYFEHQIKKEIQDQLKRQTLLSSKPQPYRF